MRWFTKSARDKPPTPEELAAATALLERAADALDGAGDEPLASLNFWETLRGLPDLNPQAVATQITELLRSSDGREVAVGGSATDTWLCARAVEPPPQELSGFLRSPRTDRAALESQFAPLILAACKPDADPLAIQAARGPNAMLRPGDIETPLALLRHRSPQVRARAAEIAGGVLADPREDDDPTNRTDAPPPTPSARHVAAVLRLLEDDEPAVVRSGAVTALGHLHEAAIERADHGEIARLTYRASTLVDDPDPGIRVEALTVCLRGAGSDGPDGAAATAVAHLDRLVAELADQDVDWRFIQLLALTKTLRLQPRAAELQGAIQRLDESAWPRRTVVHDRWPPLDERQALLDRARRNLHGEPPTRPQPPRP